MKFRLMLTGFLLLAVCAQGETRMVVKSSSATLFARANAAANVVGQAREGDILFVQDQTADWFAVSAPESAMVWVNKEFVERNKVVASRVQVRAGPGLHHDPMGTLTRGARVMALEEQDEWVKISAPSSLRVWIRATDVQDMAGAKRATATQAAAPAAAVAPVVAPVAAPASVPPPAKAAETPPVREAASPPQVRPSTPVQSVAPVVAPVAPVSEPIPVAAAVPVAVAAPIAPPPPAVQSQPFPPPRQDWVAELNLVPLPDQGKAIRIDGELRNAPMCGYAPYKLIRPNAGGVGAVTLCNVKGDSAELRNFVGKWVTLRGHKYWVRSAEVPVVVVSSVALAASAP